VSGGAGAGAVSGGAASDASGSAAAGSETSRTVEVSAGVLRDWPLPAASGGEPATKEARGQVLVVGGSVRTPGAVLLAAVAALRSGAGKLQVGTVAGVAAPLAVAVPEAYVEPLPETPDGAVAAAAGEVVAGLAGSARAVLLGPGMADADAVCAVAEAVLAALPEATVVIDALALAQLERAPGCLAALAGNAVLTPNRKEMARVLDVDPDRVQDDPAGAARRAADRFGAVVALGGGQTWVAAPGGEAWHDASGSVGLGVSGSGDAFAGIITGLAARGAPAAQAAVWGAYLHGRAGDRLAARVGRLGYLAREIVDEVPHVLTELES
jgi:ADP-dependent NAD(P)H-hydrate dehydratase